jgi:hypothetical protein
LGLDVAHRVAGEDGGAGAVVAGDAGEVGELGLEATLRDELGGAWRVLLQEEDIRFGGLELGYEVGQAGVGVEQVGRDKPKLPRGVGLRGDGGPGAVVGKDPEEMAGNDGAGQAQQNPAAGESGSARADVSGSVGPKREGIEPDEERGAVVGEDAGEGEESEGDSEDPASGCSQIPQALAVPGAAGRRAEGFESRGARGQPALPGMPARAISSSASMRPRPAAVSAGPPTFERTTRPSGATRACSLSVLPKSSA